MESLAAVQRRTLRVLFGIQVVSGVGVTVGSSVGALLAADIAGISASGLAQSAAVVGSALLALPAAAIVHRGGRRASLAAAYVVAAVGSMIIVMAAVRDSIPFLFAGFFLFGGATAAGMQARYAAVDLAPAPLRGRHLSMIVWATTLGAVAGPQFAAFAGAAFVDYRVPALAGPFVFSAALFVLAAGCLVVLMRPDPAIIARRAVVPTSERQLRSPAVGLRAALREVVARPPARVGVAAMAMGHMVMVGVMAMTPVHIRGAGHDAAHTLQIVGVVLSLHIAGMYAFSPIVGWLTDRVGRRPVIGAGVLLLIAACGVAGTAGYGTARLAIGLMLLGMGWSCSIVAGSTLLSESIPVGMRASAQGLSDAIMGLAGASAGALSGVIVHAWGYPMLALVAALAAAPCVLLVMRSPRSHFSGAAALLLLLAACGGGSSEPIANEPGGNEPGGNQPSGPPALTRTVVRQGLSNPWDLAVAPDGSIFFTEKCSGLSVLRPNGTVTRLFGTSGSALVAPDLACVGQSGVHGVALDPAFATNRTLYVYMLSTINTSPRTNRVVRLVLNSDYTSAAGRTDIVTDIPFKDAANAVGGAGTHSGGRIRFGPDGFLYVTTGDNHNQALPQSPTLLGGKVLRLTSTGAAAPGNIPPAGFDPRIFTYGHRNVQGITFRPGTGQPFISEHGPNHSDEVTPLVNGGNGGWDPKDRPALSCPGGYCGYAGDASTMPMTDLARFPNALRPSWNNNGSSQGMGPSVFLVGNQWGAWNGRLAVGIMGGARLVILELNAAGTTTSAVETSLPAARYRALTLGPDGSLYVVTDSGEIWRVTASPAAQ